MTEDNVYKVPAPIGASIGSGRGTFARVYARELRDNPILVVPNENVSEMCRLIGDLIEEVHKLKVMKHRLEDFIDTITELHVELGESCKRAEQLKFELQETLTD